MKKAVPQNVLDAFANYEPGIPEHPAGEITVHAINGGLINHSYKISCRLKPSFLLQQLNKRVFANPQDVQENYVRLWEYAESARKRPGEKMASLHLPIPVYCGKKTTIFVDNHENYWRAFEFIEESRMLTVAKRPAQAKATAMAFAGFTAAFEHFKTGLLKEVIPGFHDLGYRYEQLEEALKSENYERMARALPLINELKDRERYRHFYDLITESTEFPKRVMHHDAKIANVLFSKKDARVMSLVDFDTVMPGYFFSDLGDMIRSMVCSHDENSTAFDEISIRGEFYEAIVNGYLEIIGKQLTGPEKKYIHYAGLLMIYMQALRFLTDYLNNDVYYKTDYPEQNLARAKNQLILLKKLEEYLSNRYQLTAYLSDAISDL